MVFFVLFRFVLLRQNLELFLFLLRNDGQEIDFSAEDSEFEVLQL